MTELRRVEATRFIQPLREGGSMPGLMEASDGFKYVVKYRGAGHGTKALIAELIGGEVAREAGMRVPEQVLVDINEDFGRTEGDEEVQDLLRGSLGLNLGLHFLSGALALDPYVNPVDEETASEIVWLDAFLTNVDRTVRNTNMLLWHGETWLIDHGASLYFHHAWTDPAKAALTPFAYIKDHALLRKASRLDEADLKMRKRLSHELLRSIVAAVPEEWLATDGANPDAATRREGYATFLTERIKNTQLFLNEAKNARQSLI